MIDLDVARDALARCDWDAALAHAAGGASAELLDIAAEAHWWLGELDACIHAREAAYARYEHEGDLVAAGRLAVRLWEHHALKAHPAIAGAWLRRGRRVLAGQPESVELGALLLREAECAHGGGDLEQAAALARQVLALGRRLRSRDLEAEAQQTLGRVLIDDGQVDAGLEQLDEAMLSAVEGALSPYSTGKVQCSMISACEQLGDLRRAAEWTDAAMRWSEQHPLAMWPGICRVHHASLLQQRGQWVAAEREARRACEELDGFHVPNVAAGWVEVGEVRRRLGDLAGAEDAFGRAEELSGQQPAGLAMVRLAQGRTEAALALVTRLLAGEPWNALARGRLLPMWVHIATAAGDLDGADTATAELEQLAVDFRNPLLGAAGRTARGRVQLARKQYSDACTTLDRALQDWRSLEVPYEVATTRLLLGRAYRGCGDEETAARTLAQAADIFDRLGVLVTEPPPLPAGLTLREVDVLSLVAKGRTNKQVADELYLSERTVARHLSNIFTKTGVSTRTAAAAFAFDHGVR